MWRSPARRLLFRPLIGDPANPAGLRRSNSSIRPWAQLSSFPLPPSGGGGESAKSASGGGDKHGTGRYCNDYSTRASDIKSRRPVHSGIVQDREGIQHGSKGMMPSKKYSQEVDQNVKGVCKQRVGENISAVEKRKFLVNTLFDLKDSKEVVYGTLDAWVAWEQKFPLVALKRALLVLEKEHQWHRIVQVLKWMLSKGQGTTMGTYEQLIQALEKDNRAEEAHKIWVKKISNDLHSVPWRVCDLMISIYYRNNMLERLVKLFKGLEMYDRKPPTKSIVQKVADAYEMLGSLEEKSRIMEKYSSLFSEPTEGGFKKSRKISPKISRKIEKKYVQEKTEKKSVCCLVSDKKEVVSNNEAVNSGPSDDEIGCTA